MKVRRLIMAALIATILAPLASTTARADLRPFALSIWNMHARGIWRTEYRTREIARWYRCYQWSTFQNLWLTRRAEGVWVTGRSLTTFTQRTHCVIQNPNGPGVWRIWRTFTTRDVRRFRLHYRTYWLGWAHPLFLEQFIQTPLDFAPGNQFGFALDQVEIVLPMEPEDPDPATPENEGVMIMDETGQTRFLEPGELLPDTAMNPDGFTMATTATSELQLPAVQERLQDDMQPMPGMAEIAPGVVVEWLIDANGVELKPEPLANQSHQKILPPPTGIEGNEAEANASGRIPVLHCWALDPDGEVLGKLPGTTVIGPPVDMDGDAQIDPTTAFGGPIPMDPTIRDDFDLVVAEKPVDAAFEEDDQPTDNELAAMNAALEAAGFPPFARPFSWCIRRWIVRTWYGVDRRVVMDVWRHHYSWIVKHHIRIRGAGHRVWVSRLALSAFHSAHAHHVFGRPPVFRSFTLAHVRFFRVCYRFYCPRPGVIRVAIDQLHMVVPEDPDNPDSPLMLISTEMNELNLPSPGILAGLLPDDELPFDKNGMFHEEIDPVADMTDMPLGGIGQFDGDLTPLEQAPSQMVEIPILGNEDSDPALPQNNQLQVYCWWLNPDGTLMQDTLPDGTTLTIGPTPGVPDFDDASTGRQVTNPTDLSLLMVAQFCPADLTGDGNVDGADLAALLAAWGPNAGSLADLTGDGVVDGADLAALLASWGPC